MKTQQLTLLEARLLCRQYQHLSGRILFNEPTDLYKIECITVAPHDDLNKWIFAHNYINGDSLDKAMEFYTGPYYDVLLLARNTGDESVLVYKSLHNYQQQSSTPHQNEAFIKQCAGF
jgi:hypothetical protein